MKSLLALMRKEYMEATRTGKIMIIILLFVLFGIMSPAVAKLTPWMMEMLSESMAESGLIVTNIQVTALTSWTQFFKNIPIALIAFVLIFSDIFTKEYKSGTLLLVLTKGLSRYKVVLAKTVLLLLIWTVGYGICFTITYGYNEYFWDNSIANNFGNVKKCAVGKHPKSEKLGSTGQAACCARIHSRYFTGGSPSGLRV